MAGSIVRIQTHFSISTDICEDYLRRLDAVEAVIVHYVDIAYEIARRYARVDTGKMRDSIKKEVVREGVDSIVWEISVGEGLPDDRAYWNEYGTSRLPAQSMIRAALEQIREPMMLEIDAIMNH